MLQFDYVIENNIFFANQKLNCLIPSEKNPDSERYLESLQVESNKNRAYRNAKLPKQEAFFSSPTNRVRFENIILKESFEPKLKISLQSTECFTNEVTIKQ